MGTWHEKEGSSGIAKGGLVTGIIGASGFGLWALDKLANGGLTGKNTATQEQVVAATAMNAALAQKDAEIGQLKAEKYTDNASRDTYDRSLRDAASLVSAEAKTTAAYLAPLSKGVAALEVKEAAQAVEIAAMKKELELKDEIYALRTEKMVCEKLRPLELAIKGNADGLRQLQDQTEAAIRLEAFKRECADNKIVCYANATFAPQLLTNLAAGTGATVAQKFNPLCCGDMPMSGQTVTAAAA